jgi:hypothetical protein
LQGGRHFGAVGGEDQLKQAAPEIRPVHAFAGVGEQQKLDHVPDMIAVAPTGGPAALVEVEGEGDIHGAPHVAVTRFWVARISSGVPVGTQVAWLSNSSTGWPIEVTRAANVVNCAVAHGGAPLLIDGKVQPVIE